MNTILDKIKAYKLEDVAARKAVRSFAEVEAAAREANAPRGFAAALNTKVAAGGYALIAEVKTITKAVWVIRDISAPQQLSGAC